MSSLRCHWSRLRICWQSVRLASTRPRPRAKKYIANESIFAGAEHRPSLGGPSLGHLVSELSATKPGMEHLRKEGETMSEEQRTQARNIVKWVVGFPMGLVAAIGGGSWVYQNLWHSGGSN
ncbi:hypothetical protein K431DRAFT_130877 [Polychaeton citri CBS 116435]|uniref:Uncharacterized protein n=1 Tax=Polychaeton citri CBS 116435 TaxID=1314669 RepID=A0A9P4US60_9PEZI|nr:hypothetical protein K431DRAFT_130877 [Polychaeton citri CBS 116435]